MLLHISVSIIVAVVHMFVYRAVIIGDTRHSFTVEFAVILSVVASYTLFRCWAGTRWWHSVLRVSSVVLPVIFLVFISFLDLF